MRVPFTHCCSPAEKAVQGSEGRLCKVSFIQSNCGWADRNFGASKARPQADPQRATNFICLAIFASTTLPSSVPQASFGTVGHCWMGLLPCKHGVCLRQQPGPLGRGLVFPVRANGFDALLDLGGEEVAVLEAAGAGGPFDVEIDPAGLLVPVRLA